LEARKTERERGSFMFSREITTPRTLAIYETVYILYLIYEEKCKTKRKKGEKVNGKVL